MTPTNILSVILYFAGVSFDVLVSLTIVYIFNIFPKNGQIEHLIAHINHLAVPPPYLLRTLSIISIYVLLHILNNHAP